MKILCLGQSAYDITLPMDSFPIENHKYRLIDKKVECGGGSCNNAAYLLGLWGSDIYLASAIGKDNYGEKIKEELKKVNVNIDYFEEIDVPTTVSYIITNTNLGTRTILTCKDSNMHFSDDYNISLKPDVIMVDGNDFEVSKRILEENKDAISIIDAGSLKHGTDELCKLCDYVVCSNDFARDYTGISFIYDDIDTLKRVYNKLEHDFGGVIVITLESYGAFTKINDEYMIIPSIKVESVDSTGAGDIFHGAFTYFISEGYSLYDTIRYSNIAGALSVTKIGSKNSMPKLDEVMSYHEL